MGIEGKHIEDFLFKSQLQYEALWMTGSHRVEENVLFALYCSVLLGSGLLHHLLPDLFHGQCQESDVGLVACKA